MAEKRTRTLPPIRLSDTLEATLMRLAARDDRPLSEYVRRVLERHAFGHACMVDGDPDSSNTDRASQRDSSSWGTL